MTEIDKYIAGFKRFQENYFGSDKELFGRLSQGQNPAAMVISCSDSRVDPAILMNCEPGDLFVVRNVANLVPPYEVGGGLHGVSAALEFGVCSLEVRHMIVLGHSSCGGIRALMHGMPQGAEFIGNWVNISARAKARVLAMLADAAPQEQSHACEEESIVVSLENLMTFPWIKERVQRGTLLLHGWHFDIETGNVVAYDKEAGCFKPLS